MAATTHKLFAVRYATDPGRRRVDNLIRHHGGPAPDAPMPIDFYVWVVVGPDQVVVVDTGSDEATCSARGNRFLQDPAEGLARIGVDPAGVRHVVTTHLHWDHCGNLAAFPNARLHVQRTELAHATGPSMGSPALGHPYDLDQVVDYVRAVYAGRVTVHEGPDELVPGLSLHPVGGHTPGMQVVRVRTGRGHVVLASDAAHFAENLVTENPFPILVDVVDYVGALATLRALADGPDHVIPGHDPVVLERYPSATPETAGLAARLDLDPAGAG